MFHFISSSDITIQYLSLQQTKYAYRHEMMVLFENEETVKQRQL